MLALLLCASHFIQALIQFVWRSGPWHWLRESIKQKTNKDIINLVEKPKLNILCCSFILFRLIVSFDSNQGISTSVHSRFLRGISYREFSQLVHGHLGSMRIPLPSCAYNAIRRNFQVKEEEDFRGFEEDQE